MQQRFLTQKLLSGYYYKPDHHCSDELVVRRLVLKKRNDPHKTVSKSEGPSEHGDFQSVLTAIIRQGFVPDSSDVLGGRTASGRTC